MQDADSVEKSTHYWKILRYRTIQWKNPRNWKGRCCTWQMNASRAQDHLSVQSFKDYQVLVLQRVQPRMCYSGSHGAMGPDQAGMETPFSQVET